MKAFALYLATAAIALTAVTKWAEGTAAQFEQRQTERTTLVCQADPSYCQ